MGVRRTCCLGIATAPGFSDCVFSDVSLHITRPAQPPRSEQDSGSKGATVTTQSVPRTPRPPRQGGGRAWHRVLAGALALITAFGVSALFAPSASAALTSVGPVADVGPAGNTSKFPAFYTDS